LIRQRVEFLQGFGEFGKGACINAFAKLLMRLPNRSSIIAKVAKWIFVLFIEIVGKYSRADLNEKYALKLPVIGIDVLY
jgi:hypothetical protein